MNNKKWRYYKTVDKLLQEVEENGEACKWSILNYFASGYVNDYKQYNANLCKSLFKEFLYSGLFTPLEVCNRYKNVAKKLSSETICELRNFADKAWQESTDVDFILDMPIIARKKSDSYAIKLDYFAEKNINLCKELIDAMMKQDVFSFNSFDALAPSNASIRIYYYQKYREFETKKMAEEIKRRNETPWQELEDFELIGYRVTEVNKWEILEYFAEHKVHVFLNLIKYYGTALSSKVVCSFAKKDILEHYKDADLSTLPSALQSYIEYLKVEVVKLENEKKEKAEQRKQERKEKKKEELLSWADEKGELIQLFKIKKLYIGSIEDYRLILSKYLKSDLSILGFCMKYDIDSVEGFEKMLDKFSAENPKLAEQIANKKRRKSENYLNMAKLLIIGIVKNEVSVKEAINYATTYSFDTLQDLTTAFFKDVRMVEMFTYRVICYYHERLNSYDSSPEEENVSKFLTNSEIRFILGNDLFKKFQSNGNVDISMEFINKVKFMRAKYFALFQGKVNGYEDGKIAQKLQIYGSKFKANEYLENETTLLLEDGSEAVVTEDIVKQAVNYANKHKLCQSLHVMKILIRSFANKKVEFDKELKTLQPKKQAVTVEEVFESAKDEVTV